MLTDETMRRIRGEVLDRLDAEPSLRTDDPVHKAARRVVDQFREIPKGKDWPKGNPTPEEWGKIHDGLGDLGDALDEEAEQ